MKQLVQIFIIISAFALASCNSSVPETVGLRFNQLQDCPGSPNCVSTTTEQEDKLMDALPFKGSLADTKQALKATIEATERTKIIKESLVYIHAEFQTKSGIFTDDVEFLLDQNSKKVHFKSASRVGHSDLGANRKRMEKFKMDYLK